MKTISTQKAFLAAAFVAAMLSGFAAHAGGSYKFTVRCPDDAVVIQWNTGDIDPGKEYLRVATGTAHPGCSVGDFDQTQDGYLRVEINSGGTGVLQGLDPLKVLGNIFGF